MITRIWLITITGRTYSVSHFTPLTRGEGGLSDPECNFSAFGDPLAVTCINMFHADFSCLSI